MCVVFSLPLFFLPSFLLTHKEIADRTSVGKPLNAPTAAILYMLGWVFSTPVKLKSVKTRPDIMLDSLCNKMLSYSSCDIYVAYFLYLPQKTAVLAVVAQSSVVLGHQERQSSKTLNTIMLMGQCLTF